MHDGYLRGTDAGYAGGKGLRKCRRARDDGLEAMREDDAPDRSMLVFQEMVGAGRRTVVRFSTPITRELLSKC